MKVNILFDYINHVHTQLLILFTGNAYHGATFTGTFVVNGT